MLRAYYTVYVDKPMRGHGLMQANGVFRDKPSGLVVDYLGLAHELKRALAPYTESRGRRQRRAPRGGPGTTPAEGAPRPHATGWTWRATPAMRTPHGQIRAAWPPPTGRDPY